jgi:hypothetical protein
VKAEKPSDCRLLISLFTLQHSPFFFTGVFVQDISYIALTLLFFAVGILYTQACGKL